MSMALLTCPECKGETRVLVFHDNGYQSCQRCAPEIRKRAKLEAYAFAGSRGFDGAEHYKQMTKRRR